MAPTNFPATNPVLLERVLETGGQRLVESAKLLVELLDRSF